MDLSKSVLVLGFYSKGSVGDNAFRPAYTQLWGDRATFTFKDRVPEDIDRYDACMIGGGSFLDQAPFPGVDDLRRSGIPVGFIGVGWTHRIHPAWTQLVDQAQVIVPRERVEGLPRGSDLVFSRPFSASPAPKTNRVLVIGNRFVIPSGQSPEYKARTWHWFPCEFAKALDKLVDEGVALEFHGMDPHDHWFTREVVACMRNKDNVVAHLSTPTEKSLVEAITRSSHVITLRFHGMVFSALLGRPFTCVAHHDKLWDFCADHNLSSVTDYYGLSEDKLRKAQELEPSLSQLREIVADQKERWAQLAPRVAEKLQL